MENFMTCSVSVYKTGFCEIVLMSVITTGETEPL